MTTAPMLAFAKGGLHASAMILSPFYRVARQLSTGCRPGLFLVLLAGIAYPGSSQTDAPERDIAWEQQALMEAEEDRANGTVRITREVSSADRVEFDFRLEPQYTDSRVRFAVSIPDVSETSVSVVAYTSSRAGDIGRHNPTAVLETVGWVRGFKIARVHFSRDKSAERTLTSGTVRLLFSAGSASVARDKKWVDAETTGPVFAAVQRLVVNPSGPARFIAPEPAAVPTPVELNAWNPFAIDTPFRLKIPIREKGLYRFTGADLQSSGVVLAKTNPQHLSLVVDGIPQSLHRVPGSGGQADAISPADEFLFYGHANPSPYSATNMYWLVLDPQSASRGFPVGTPARGGEATSAELFIDTAAVEEDHPPVLTRNDQFLTILGYRWVWWTWTEGRGPTVPNQVPLGQSRQVTFDLPGLYTTGGEVTARAYLYNHIWPSGSGPFTLRISINNSQPVELLLETAHTEEREFRIPVAALRESGNIARVELLKAGEADAVFPTNGQGPESVQICFDRLEVDYPRQYRLNDEPLRFRSPLEAAAVLSSRQEVPTTSSRLLRYEITGVQPGLRPVVLDVTETAPLLMNADVTGGRLRFQARETQPREYLATHLERIPRASLLPMAPQQDLRGKDVAADYVIVAHPLFSGAITPFAEMKRRAGHVVQVVNVDHVYDQFAAGQMVPHSIRRFLYHAATNWKPGARGPAASYVLLVGDSTSAYRNEFSNAVINYVPSMTVSESGERYASDLWFGTSLGDDLLADSFIGRFSVNNVEDLATIVAKQADYMAPNETAPWQNTLAYVADHSEFEEAITTVINRTVPSRFFLNRLMLAEKPWIDNYYFPLEVAEAKKSKVSPVMTAMIRDMFNMGAAMVTYFGHGSPNVWSNERIWFGGDSDNSDNRMLTNRDRLSFILNLTCNSGAIDYPMPRWNVCISEDFMRIPNGGAIGCYVPSGPGITSQHEKFTLELNRTLLQERVEPLGPALALANWRYLVGGNPPDLTRMFILLGDPALSLNFAGPVEEPLSTKGTAGGSKVKLPEEFASLQNPGWYQYVRRGKSLAASGIEQWTTGAVTLHSPPGSLDEGPVLTAVLAPGLEGGKAVALVNGDVPDLEVAEVNETRTHSGVDLEVIVKNLSRIPSSGLVFELRRADGTLVASSESFRITPEGQQALRLSISDSAELLHLLPFYRLAGGTPQKIKTEEPIIVLPEPSRASQVAAIDPASVELSYINVQGKVQGALSARVYNLTSGTLANTLVQVANAGGDTVTSSVLPQVEPRGSAQIKLSIQQVPEGTLTYSMGLLYEQRPTGNPVNVLVGKENLPDLAVLREDIRHTPESPMDGETLFFDVVIRNTGKSAIAGVQVEGLHDANTTAPTLMESRVARSYSRVDLSPGSSETVRLRWDPFKNAGVQHLLFRASSAQHAEMRIDNNATTLTLKVRTKSRVRPVNIGIRPLTPEDRQKKQIKVVATLRNDGESPAQGVRVVFYPTPKVTPKDVMGEVILDVVPPGETREAVLTYKLKPGEETRPFLPSCETMLKGSLQRTPLSSEQPSR